MLDLEPRTQLVRHIIKLFRMLVYIATSFVFFFSIARECVLGSIEVKVASIIIYFKLFNIKLGEEWTRRKRFSDLNKINILFSMRYCLLKFNILIRWDLALFEIMKKKILNFQIESQLKSDIHSISAYISSVILFFFPLIGSS